MEALPELLFVWLEEDVVITMRMFTLVLMGIGVVLVLTVIGGAIGGVIAGSWLQRGKRVPPARGPHDRHTTLIDL